MPVLVTLFFVLNFRILMVPTSIGNQERALSLRCCTFSYLPGGQALLQPLVLVARVGVGLAARGAGCSLDS